MSPRYLSCAETATMVRKALKQAFPEIKFSVRSKTYSMGASITVSWNGGPTVAQVDKIAQVFAGGTFDGMTDYKGGVIHELEGEQIHFGADFIFCQRREDEAKLAQVAACLARYPWDDAVRYVDTQCNFPPHASARTYADTPEQLARLFLHNAPAPEFDGRTSELANKPTVVRTY